MAHTRTIWGAWQQQGNTVELFMTVQEAESLASLWHRGARPEYYRPATEEENRKRAISRWKKRHQVTTT